jgi:hypothetical protein
LPQREFLPLPQTADQRKTAGVAVGASGKRRRRAVEVMPRQADVGKEVLEYAEALHVTLHRLTKVMKKY